jgi:hypothetical protein
MALGSQLQQTGPLRPEGAVGEMLRLAGLESMVDGLPVQALPQVNLIYLFHDILQTLTVHWYFVTRSHPGLATSVPMEGQLVAQAAFGGICYRLFSGRCVRRRHEPDSKRAALRPYINVADRKAFTATLPASPDGQA